MPPTALVLASSSPRRREILAWLGIPYTARSGEVNETPRNGEDAEGYVRRLAVEKALSFANDGNGHDLVLAADTTVVDEEGIMGKPANSTDATAMLRRLRAKTHSVCTGIAVRDLASGRMETDLCVSAVPMREYTEEEIAAYVRSGDPLDKAGAYAIRNKGFHPSEGFAGCFASVTGMPLCHTSRTLAKFGLLVKANIPEACKQGLDYDCPISARVLRGEDVG